LGRTEARRGDEPEYQGDFYLEPRAERSSPIDGEGGKVGEARHLASTTSLRNVHSKKRSKQYKRRERDGDVSMVEGHSLPVSRRKSSQPRNSGEVRDKSEGLGGEKKNASRSTVRFSFGLNGNHSSKKSMLSGSLMGMTF